MCLRLSGMSVFLVAAAAVGQQNSRPDFGPNVLLFDPGQPAARMQQDIDHVYASEQHNEFGPNRYALLFLPGIYHLDVPIGYYTEVRGLGETPDAVQIVGNVHADASLPKDNATCVFWRGIENFAVRPRGSTALQLAPGSMQWAVSQAAPMRRMHIEGNLMLHQNHGWASGGWMADSVIDGTVDSGTQQQWISRNSDWTKWTGSNWNMVFVGVPHAPAGAWPDPAYTTVSHTPLVREKPYLEVNAARKWNVRVPGLRSDSTGASWQNAVPDTDRAIPIEDFYIAHSGHDTAASMNAQLAQGKHILLMPGIYNLSEPIRVTKRDTVVLGLGFATLRPTSGTAAMVTAAGVDGLTIAGLLFDAGPRISPVLLQIGAPGQPHRRHLTNPILLADVFFRDGGAGEGRTIVNLEANADDTIIDHAWIWRADHGAHVGWTDNLSRNGMVVNGDDVIAYGLFVEHHQQFQVLWNGERGRTYMYQSEIPYDPPNQAAFKSGRDTDGWASYKISNTVQQHEAWGLGVYSVFTHPDIFVTRAIEAPPDKRIHFSDMITTCLNNYGGIRNVINNAGGSATCHPKNWPRLKAFP